MLLSTQAYRYQATSFHYNQLFSKNVNRFFTLKSNLQKQCLIVVIHRMCNSRENLKSAWRILSSPSCAKSSIEFFERKTRSSKIGTGRRSIYNICIMNYCKLTFEFFKNYIFEKRRQFLNRILGRNQFPPRKAGEA